MATFRHHPEGRIWIDDVMIPLNEFLIEEPGYALLAGMLGREYNGAVDRTYNAKGEKRVNGSNAELDSYIAKLPTYLANIQSRIQTSEDNKADINYAPDLATAKSKRKQAAKKEAVALYRAYEDTDLEVPQAQLASYRASLVAQKTTIVFEINALTTIKQIREYQYLGWPVPV